MEMQKLEMLKIDTFKKTYKCLYPKCSINNKGTIRFNDGAKKEYDLAAYKFVVMHYNKEHLIIFIEATNDQTKEGAIRIIKGKKYGVSLAARNFFHYYRILPNKTITHKTLFSENKKMIIIELCNGTSNQSTRTTL